MKKNFIFLIIFSLASISIFNACKPVVKKEVAVSPIKLLTALEYNNIIVNQQEKVLENLTDYSKIYDNNINSEQANLVEKSTLNSIDTAIRKITEIKDFHGDTIFQRATLQWLQFYKGLMLKEYKEIRSIMEKEAKITKADLKHVNEIHAEISKKEKPILANFTKAQKEFAKKNSLVLPKK